MYKLMGLMLVAGLMVSGCSLSYNDNLQNCTVRTSADVATSVAVENYKLDQGEIDQIYKVANDIEKYIDTGSFTTTPGSELSAQLLTKIPEKYQKYFGRLTDYLGSMGANKLVSDKTIRMIKSILYGVKSSCAQWKTETK